LLENSIDFMNASSTPATTILANLKPKYLELKSVGCLGIKRDFFSAINFHINEYDKEFESKGHWMKNFFDELIRKEECLLDVFNLNYDTWIERIIPDYVDGYEAIDGYDFKRFIAHRYLDPKERHTISHIHGQICFAEADFRREDINLFSFEEQGYTLYKYPSFKAAEYVRKKIYSSDDTNQSGHSMIVSNIITGRMKTDKLLWSPFHIYMYGLIRALIENHELIIIGYGFGDYYINSLLFKYLGVHHDKHVRIITYADPDEFECRVIENGDPFYVSTESTFVRCAMRAESWCKPYNRRKDGRFVSKASDAELYLNGFKDYCKRYISGEFDHSF